MENIGGVLVSGAGPVGLLTALGLAKAGVRVTLLDAAATINDSPRAAIYYPVVQDVLERYGLLADAVEAGYQSTEFQFRVPATGTAIKISTSILDGLVAHPSNLHLGQHTLAELVLRHLQRYPNADVRWGTAVVGMQQDRDGVTVRVDGADGQRDLRGEWLIGADGARSTVRKLMELPFEGHTWPDRFVATNVRFDFGKYGFAPINQVSDPVDWAVVARLGKDDLWRCTFGEDASLDEADVFKRIPERYAAILPSSESYEIVSASPYRVHERCAPTFRIGRVLLAGDAAHVCNPCGGLGLTTGLMDAVMAVDALSAVISGEAGPDLLDFYSQERRRVFLEVSSPLASNFKRLLAEKDPQKRLEDEAFYRAAAEDIEFGRNTLLYTGTVAGNPLPLGSLAR